MTAVVTPISYQAQSRSGWSNGHGNGNEPQSSVNPAMPEATAKAGTLPRKSAQRTNSSSSLSSNGSTTSNTTVTSQSNGVQNGELTWGGRKKPARGIWPSTKAEPVSGLSTARPQSVPPSPSGSSAASAVSALVPTQNATQIQVPQQVGARNQGQLESTAVLYLTPLNGTFEKKTMIVPIYPDVLRIGRQTNQKTIPTPTNGYFDSKVLSRQHAEVWSDLDGKIWIRDVKSSNGTFVNGKRLSQENRDSDPHIVKDQDHLELGIDIVSEDHKQIVHHKVSAKVERAGIYSAAQEQAEARSQEQQPPQVSNGQLVQPQSQKAHSRNLSQGQISGQAHYVNPRGGPLGGIPAYQAKWLQPVTMEQIVKRLNGELRQARSQRQNLSQSDLLVNAVMGDRGLPTPPSQKLISPNRTFDTKSRYTFEPPGPPPQQPLPEKPNAPALRTKARESSSAQPQLRRHDTERPRGPNGSISTKLVRQDETPQAPKLVEMLNSAQKELSTQGVRLHEMEETLRKERQARSLAEARASQLESAKLIPGTEATVSTSLGAVTKERALEEASEEDDVPARVQAKLDLMRAEMEGMRAQMERYRQRAENAEAESEKDRKTLTEMVKAIRQREDSAASTGREKREQHIGKQRDEGLLAREDNDSVSHIGVGNDPSMHEATEDNSEGSIILDLLDGAQGSGVPDSRQGTRRRSIANANGTMTGPLSRLKPASSKESIVLKSKSPGASEALVSTTSTAISPLPQGAFMQSAPYASMLGVVLLGVGMMAYLNGWQNVVPRER